MRSKVRFYSLLLAAALLLSACSSSPETLSESSLTAQTLADFYVIPGGSGLEDGSNWENAFATLQNALQAASSRSSRTVIWLAAGMYYPDEGAGQTASDRSATFQLRNNVEIYGGFSGNEPATFDLAERNLSANLTVLSGDINQNGEGNSYTVVTGSNTNASAILDGVTITAGSADSTLQTASLPEARGGGMLNVRGSPTLRNVIFSNNFAQIHGGGMANINSSPVLRQVTFINNASNGNGGGMHNDASSPSLFDVRFQNNRTISLGGGMANRSSNPLVQDTQFHENSSSTHGGGMGNEGSFPTLRNVSFIANVADSRDGGGMYNASSSPNLRDVTFDSNTANRGGGLFNTSSAPTLQNVTISRNSANSGGGILNISGSSAQLNNVTISQNIAREVGGGIHNILSSPTLRHVTITANRTENALSSGGISNDQSAPLLINSLVANNFRGANRLADIEGSVDPASRHNLIGLDADLNGIVDGQNGNLIGTESAPIDPRLDVLANNGGLTSTHALLIGSRAINAAQGQECLPDDQRGMARPQGTQCDIGAFEALGRGLDVFALVINASPLNGGRVNGEAQFVQEVRINNRVSLSATPNSGYRFVRWDGDGICVNNATSNPLIFLMPARNINCRAIFEPSVAPDPEPEPPEEEPDLLRFNDQPLQDGNRISLESAFLFRPGSARFSVAGHADGYRWQTRDLQRISARLFMTPNGHLIGTIRTPGIYRFTLIATSPGCQLDPCRIEQEIVVIVGSRR